MAANPKSAIAEAANAESAIAEAVIAESILLQVGLLAERRVELESESRAIEATVAARAGATHLLLERLLGMAQRYRSAGDLHSAMEVYWELVESHGGTSEAETSRNLLFQMAADYERSGATRMARSIYERGLADFED